MIRAAIVEDDNACTAQLQGYLERYEKENGTPFSVTRFENGAALLDGYRSAWDVIFLDIEMPLLDGMSAAERLRGKDKEVLIVFVTNLARYAIRGFAVNALDYLLKPVSYVSFSLTLDKVQSALSRRDERTLLLHRKEDMLCIRLSKIYYVEVEKHNLIFHTEEGDFSIRGSLQNAEEELGSTFAKCNSCYLVNLRYVTRLGRDTVTVAGYELQISRRSRTAFLQALTDYVGGKGS